MTYRPNHHYTVSPAAKTKLIELFRAAATSGPSTERQRRYRQRPEMMIDALGAPVSIETAHTRQATGITHALIQLHRTYDLSDYFPKPTIPMYLTIPGTTPLFYNPPDSIYLNEAAQDDTPWSELPEFERQDRLTELQRKRGWHPDKAGRKRGINGKLANRLAGIGNLHLALPNDTRRYYHNLRLFHHIPLLPGCRTPNNLTASISTVLEAIGTGHLELPADYIYAISTPNKRLARHHSQLNSQDGKRKFGNHSHEPYIQKEWRALPRLDQFTQADVDYCLREDNVKSLGDLALEAISLNPQLQLPPEALSTHIPTVIDSQLSATTQRAKPHIDLVPTLPQPPAILYKGRDVSACINLAIEAHYLDPAHVSFPKLSPLAAEHGLPLYMLQRLATREWVRRTLAEDEEHISD